MNKQTCLTTEDDLWRWAEGRQHPSELPAAPPRDPRPEKDGWLSLRWLRRGRGVKGR